MAFDSTRNRTVLFGGGNPLLGDTWEWDGTTWTQQFPPTAPSARVLSGMAFDSARKTTVLFAGREDPTLLRKNDTWEWDGTTWTQRTIATPPPAREVPAMTFDPVRKKIVTFGGYGTMTLGDTWELDGMGWSMRSAIGSSPRESAAMSLTPF